MHSMRQRFLDITASAFMSLLVGAILTALSTVVRDIILSPSPIVSDLRVSSTSALYHVRSTTLLSTETPGASLYYLPGSSGDSSGDVPKRLPSNIAMVDMRDSPGDSEDDLRRKAWQRKNMPNGFSLGIRTIERLVLFLSGTIDFTPCWDWNTKAIYVSLVARFSSDSMPQNDVTMLDVVLRPVSLPPPLAHLAEKRRQERRAASLRGDTEDARVSAGAAATAPLTDAERQQLTAVERTLGSKEHDHPSVYVDHIDKRIVLENSFKYYIDAFDSTSLAGNTVDVLLRYQVMSHSGWEPLREEVLGHQVKATAPAKAVEWNYDNKRGPAALGILK